MRLSKSLRNSVTQAIKLLLVPSIFQFFHHSQGFKIVETQFKLQMNVAYSQKYIRIYHYNKLIINYNQVWE